MTHTFSVAVNGKLNGKSQLGVPIPAYPVYAGDGDDVLHLLLAGLGAAGPALQ